MKKQKAFKGQLLNEEVEKHKQQLSEIKKLRRKTEFYAFIFTILLCVLCIFLNTGLLNLIVIVGVGRISSYVFSNSLMIAILKKRQQMKIEIKNLIFMLANITVTSITMCSFMNLNTNIIITATVILNVTMIIIWYTLFYQKVNQQLYQK